MAKKIRQPTAYKFSANGVTIEDDRFIDGPFDFSWLFCSPSERHDEDQQAWGIRACIFLDDSLNKVNNFIYIEAGPGVGPASGWGFGDD